MKCSLIVLLTAASPWTWGFVIPTASQNLDADGMFLFTPFDANGRVYQQIFANTEVIHAIGRNIIGTRFRLNQGTATAHPSVTATFTSFSISIGRGPNPATMSNTFLNNYIDTPTNVRSGALLLLANSYTTGANPNQMGPGVFFDAPFPFSGGHLTIEYRMSQSVPAIAQIPLDALSVVNAPGNGYGVKTAAKHQNNRNAVDGASSNGVVTDLIMGETVPNVHRTSEADGSFIFTTETVPGRTYQLLVRDTELTSILGQRIIGILLRQDVSSSIAWPVVAQTFSTFDIRLSPGRDPATMSNSFATNVTGSQVLVRSGNLVVAQNQFPFGTSPNKFGMEIAFNTPYSYSGGHLALEIRTSNQTVGPGVLCDALSSSGAPGNGYGQKVAARWASSPTASTGSVGNAVVTQFVTDAGDARTITGILTLQDYEPAPSTESVEFEIREPGSVMPIETHNVTPFSEGSYLFATNVAPGTYDITCRGSHWLRSLQGGIVISNSGANSVNFSLLNGDADPDNEVNLVDFGITAGSFGLAIGDPGFDPMADLNGDGEVNLIDIGTVSANFGQAGHD